jgi:hypothetical protein
MTAARLSRLADSVSGEALLCPAGSERSAEPANDFEQLPEP